MIHTMQKPPQHVLPRPVLRACRPQDAVPGHIGNQAGLRLAQRGVLQAKLVIGAPDDAYEREADRVARQVMRSANDLPAIGPAPPNISRKCASCENEKLIQSKPAARQGETSDAALQQVDNVLGSAGRPFDPALRGVMERRFGRDFSTVRLHDDARATMSTRAINAEAFTVGNHVVFDARHYAPTTRAGQLLLAHELAHVVQQGHARLQPRAGTGQAPSAVASAPARIQRTRVCSKQVENIFGHVGARHSYIDDTGRDNCLGSSLPGNYAVQTLVSGNGVSGCAIKTATSNDPGTYTPMGKPCLPAAGVTDLSACLKAAYTAYPSPNEYGNPGGPNSNSFAATLARACCADSTANGLGWVPAWDHPAAGACPQQSNAQQAPPDARGGAAPPEKLDGGAPPGGVGR